MSLPLEWFDRVVAAPGTILIEREESPAMYGSLIIIPESVRLSKRSAVARVHSIGPRSEAVREGPGAWLALAPPSLKPGDHVMLAVGVGRKIEFGPRGERCLYSARPSELLMRLPRGERAEHSGEPRPERFPEDTSRFQEARKDEGWLSG